MRTIVASLGGWLLLATALSLPAAGADDSSYRIGPKDLLEIRVFEVPELNVERRVSENGTISLPLLGDFAVNGLTATEVKGRLKQLLESRYVQRASVEVQLREYRSRPITLMGAVKQPGPLAFSGRWTLVEAIAAAGGVADGHGDTIFILRRAGNGLTDQIGVKVADLLVHADPRANLPIFANDLINVPATTRLTLYCLGEVNNPGPVEFTSDERITLLAAVARCGGLSDRASKKLLVKRRAAGGLEEELPVDYRRIVAGKDPDLQMAEGDVLVVKESFF